MSYYFPTDPPYFLFVVALLAGITCGRAFEMNLRQLVGTWADTKTTAVLLELRGVQLQLPYLGMGISVGIFLACGLEIFGFPSSLAYTVAIPLTLGSAYFVWRQLGKLLVELERGGSAAMDLDAFEE
jgi:hypothetical protein